LGRKKCPWKGEEDLNEHKMDKEDTDEEEENGG
jgi:hypothetical protein